MLRRPTITTLFPYTTLFRSYETEPLAEDVTIAGPIVANLHASTSGTDADWVVKLIDVLPGDTPNNDPNPAGVKMGRSEEHTSELQSQSNLVCRLLLEKKKQL